MNLIIELDLLKVKNTEVFEFNTQKIFMAIS